MTAEPLDLDAATPPELFGHLQAVINEVASRDHDRSMTEAKLHDRIAELEAGRDELQASSNANADLVLTLNRLLADATGKPAPSLAEVAGRPAQVVADAYRTEVERDRLRERVAELEGGPKVRLTRRTPEEQQLYYVRKTAELIGAKADAEGEAVRLASRARVLEGFLSGLVDAAEPFRPDAPPWGSHAQAEDARHRLRVAVAAARIMLGEQSDDGRGAVLFERGHLALLVGALTESDAPAFSPEVRAAVNAAEAVLQVADGRPTEVVRSDAL